MTSETAIETAARPGRPGDVAIPGARLRRWTLRRMLAEPLRDLLAVRGAGAEALVLGCGAGELSRNLLEIGFARVTGVDSRPDLLADAEAMRAEHAAGAAGVRFLSPSELPPDAGFDLVLVEDPAGSGRPDEGSALRDARAMTAGACAIVTDSRLRSRELALEAGFGSVSLIQPPADAERSFVLLERALLIARPQATPAPGDEEPADG